MVAAFAAREGLNIIDSSLEDVKNAQTGFADVAACFGAVGRRVRLR